METHELIKALKDGFGLRKIHTYNSHDETIGVEFFYYDKEHHYFERKGWASALGSNSDRLEEIFKHPERWEVAGKIEERQWITENPISA